MDFADNVDGGKSRRFRLITQTIQQLEATACEYFADIIITPRSRTSRSAWVAGASLFTSRSAQILDYNYDGYSSKWCLAATLECIIPELLHELSIDGQMKGAVQSNTFQLRLISTE